MKKSFLLLPVSIAILTACSSNSPAPIENVDSTHSPGVMQPLANNSSGTWQPEIQQNTMPNTMGNSVPTGTQTPQPNFQPTYQPVQQPTATQPQPALAPVQPQAKTVTKTVSDCTSSGAINVPRNPNTNAPDYNQIQKGSYKGNTYKVNKGDTMFLIAYLAGMDVKDLASMNNIEEPYSLSVGQTLKISNCSIKTITTTVPVKTTVSAAPAAPAEPEVTYTPGANGTQIGSDGTVIGPIKSGVATGGTSTPAFTNNTPVNANVVAPVASNVAWQWPTQGKVILGFSNSDGGNKGIDISGSRGQPVKAAASGRIVYAGNALRGYGNLIIIKHNDDFLSAYAHNDKILVSDQQEVKAGQEIAKMGSTGTNAVKLHFEIRYKGKSVDPVRYLPRK